VNDPDSLSDEELDRALITAMRAKGSGGVLVFSLGHAVKEGRMETIRRRFAGGNF
jgi:hypothetical protein